MSVFVSRGMRLSIPAGGLTFGIDAAGKFAGSVQFEVGIILFPIWLEIALQHLRDSHAAHLELVRAHAEKNDEAKGRYLEIEFIHGMQSIMAPATAVDAFYASIKDLAKLTPEEKARLKENKKGTARPAHVKETIRRVFNLNPEQSAKVERVLLAIYQFRDRAVHPPSDLRAPVYHSAIEAGAEWRFVAFSYSNAREIFSGAMSLFTELVKRGLLKESRIQKESAEWELLLQPIVTKWSAEIKAPS